jgi:hypothetical protein
MQNDLEQSVLRAMQQEIHAVLEIIQEVMRGRVLICRSR